MRKSCGWVEQEISAGADGGPCSRVSARKTLRSAPIDTSGNFPAHVSWRGREHFLTTNICLTHKC